MNFGSQEIIDNKFSHLKQNVESDIEEESANYLNSQEIVDKNSFINNDISNFWNKAKNCRVKCGKGCIPSFC